MRQSKKSPIVPEPYKLGYARVSTEEQNLDMQIAALKRAGVKDEDIYVEKVSTRRSKRPVLDQVIGEIREGDHFYVWKLDRIARSRADLYTRLDQISGAGASLHSITEDFDFSSAIGKLILGVFVLIAEFERDLISARTSAGMKAFKERGGIPGRKPVLDEKGIVKGLALLNSGKHSKAEVGRQLGIAPTTINNYFVWHDRSPHWRRVKKAVK
jgi:DNA invertase Pin-like site-specific DNA recombinase